MPLHTEPYLAQVARWPADGRHILAQFDAESVVVYQAFRPAIGHFAAENGRFGGEFQMSRMSWIKPNFLWMMYRSSWGRMDGQEVILAVRLQRTAFDAILSEAVSSNFDPTFFANQFVWRGAIRQFDVRLQWDPDHGPSGLPVQRRAIQLGLRNDVLARYVSEWVLEIEDISEFVRTQHQNLMSGGEAELLTPQEAVYPVEDPETRRRLGL